MSSAFYSDLQDLSETEPSQPQSQASSSESSASSTPAAKNGKVQAALPGLPADFEQRHIGPREAEIQQMLALLGFQSLADLIDQAVPASIRLNRPLQIDNPRSEAEALADLKGIASKNKIYRSFIGMGYANCITPPVIQRNILENPGWYTQYTPYQPEIAQGRLEALLNFQTMVIDLTGLEIANASLLDEATAAAEAMAMSYGLHKGKANAFWVSELCHPQTIDVVKTRALPLGIDVIVGDHRTFEFDTPVFGVLLQYPATDGAIFDYQEFVDRAHAAGALVTVAADILSLTLLKPPGEFGADIAVGSTQRLGVPLGYGGPHAAYFATKEAYKRQIPGRLVGVSKDALGQPALRLALQTREQHIRRDKATSNICTAQVLLAVIAGMYAVYHGAEGLKQIADRIHTLTRYLATQLQQQGYKVSDTYFDTLRIEVGNQQESILENAIAHQINLRPIDKDAIGITLDETTTPQDLTDLLTLFPSTHSPIHPSTHPLHPHPHHPLPHPSRLLRLSIGNRDAAVSLSPPVEGSVADDGNDSAWLLHDEAECYLGDDSDYLDRVWANPPLCADRSGAGLSGDVPTVRTVALRNYWVRRHFPPAKCGFAG